MGNIKMILIQHSLVFVHPSFGCSGSSHSDWICLWGFETMEWQIVAFVENQTSSQQSKSLCFKWQKTCANSLILHMITCHGMKSFDAVFVVNRPGSMDKRSACFNIMGRCTKKGVAFCPGNQPRITKKSCSDDLIQMPKILQRAGMRFFGQVANSLVETSSSSCAGQFHEWQSSFANGQDASQECQRGHLQEKCSYHHFDNQQAECKQNGCLQQHELNCAATSKKNIDCFCLLCFQHKESDEENKFSIHWTKHGCMHCETSKLKKAILFNPTHVDQSNDEKGVWFVQLTMSFKPWRKNDEKSSIQKVSCWFCLKSGMLTAFPSERVAGIPVGAVFLEVQQLKFDRTFFWAAMMSFMNGAMEQSSAHSANFQPQCFSNRRRRHTHFDGWLFDCPWWSIGQSNFGIQHDKNASAAPVVCEATCISRLLFSIQMRTRSSPCCRETISTINSQRETAFHVCQDFELPNSLGTSKVQIGPCKPFNMERTS